MDILVLDAVILITVAVRVNVPDITPTVGGDDAVPMLTVELPTVTYAESE